MAAFTSVLKLVKRITGKSAHVKETQGHLKERHAAGVRCLGANFPERSSERFATPPGDIGCQSQPGGAPGILWVEGYCGGHIAQDPDVECAEFEKPFSRVPFPGCGPWLSHVLAV